jgi:competence protein ComEC
MQPLFVYGLAFLFGIAFRPLLLIPIFTLAWLADSKRYLPALCIAAAGYIWAHSTTPLPPEGSYEGVAWLRFTEISSKTFHGQKKLSCKAICKTFTTEDKTYHEIPVYLSLKEFKADAGQDWEVSGKLRVSERGAVFKPSPTLPWKGISNCLNLTQIRFNAKEAVKHWIHESIPDPRSASLLAGLATGDLDDKSIRFQFGLLGLTHLLAISGFHFSLVALLISQLFKPFLSPKKRAFILIALLGLYALFLGGSPSILRAFAATLLFLAAPLFNAASNSENNLGAALLLLLTLDPALAHHIGFQLSFLATGSILFFYPWVESHLKSIMPAKTRREIYALGKKDRLVTVIFHLLRKSVALNVAVTVALLPPLFTLFHEFPLGSLFYNLFFPFLLSLSMGLLIASLPFPCLHTVNSVYTRFLLNLAEDAPPNLSGVIKTNFFNEEFSIIFITLLFTFVFYKKRSSNYNIVQINL